MFSRRDILKAGLAALVPAWLVTPEPRRFIDLGQFCAKTKRACSRYDMRQPFYQDEWTYATNARLAVRVRPLLGDVRGPGIEVPPASSLAWDHSRRDHWLPWPNTEPVLAANSWCPACGGTGWQGNLRECEKCDGMGGSVANWETDRWGECEKCQGHGSVGDHICRSCRGNPLGVFPDVLPLPNYVGYVAAEYHALVRGLPGIEYSPLPEMPIRFRFDGGTGLIMPLDRKSAEKRILQAAAQ